MFENTAWHKHLPDKSLDVSHEHFEAFFRTMYERQEIWYKRNVLKQKRPWTKDPILGQFKFTNVYRELDRSSQYLIRKVFLEEEIGIEVLSAILLFRIYNQPETFEALGYFPKYEQLREEDFWLKFIFDLGDLEGKGIKTLNQEAYKINTYIWAGEPRWLAYANHIYKEYCNNLDQLWHIVKNISNPNAIIKQLRTVTGVGMFLAHEYYQDICDARTYFSKDFAKVNKNMWTNVGPGAKVGLRLIFPALPEDEQIKGITWLEELAVEQLPDDFKYIRWKPEEGKHVLSDYSLTLHNIEMWLCEYQKYWKMQIGIGKQRRKFQPKSDIR